MTMRDHTVSIDRPAPTRSATALVRAWLLLLPMLFLAVHGQPSFMQGNRNIEGGTALSAAAASSSDEGDSVLERIFVYAAYGIVAALCLQDIRRIRKVLPFASPLLMLAALALCSAVWSQDPISSLRSGAYYTMDTLLALYLLATFTLEEIMSLITMTGLLVALCSGVTILFFPQYGLVHMAAHTGVWQGIFSEKNDAAKNMVFLLTPILGRQVLRPKNLLYAALMLPFIVMTGSKSALLAIVILILFAVGQSAFARLSRKTASFLAVVISLLVVVAAGLFLFAGAQLTALLGRDMTLTGRTDIWSLLIQSGLQRPWLGYGYSAFWTGLDGESGKIYETLHWVFTYAHNGLLEVWLQLGFAGLAVVLYALVRAVKNALHLSTRTRSAGTEWLIRLLLLTLIYNLDEGTILFTRSLVSMLFVLTCTGLARAAWQRSYQPRFVRALSAGLHQRAVHA